MPVKTEVANGNEDHHLCPLCSLFFVERVPNLAYSHSVSEGFALSLIVRSRLNRCQA